MLASGVQVVLLTDEALLDKIQERFGQAGLVVDSLRLEQARQYFQSEHNSQQWWLDFLRRASASRRMNLETVNNYVNWVKTEAPAKRKAIFPLVRGALVAAPLVSRPARPGRAPAPVYPQYLQRPVRAFTNPTWSLPARRAGAWTATCCARPPPERAHGCHRPGVG